MHKTELFKSSVAAAKKYWPVLLLAALAAVFLLWPGGGDKEVAATSEAASEGFCLEDTERRMEEILSKMAGCGKTGVMLSLDESMRDVLAQNSTQDLSDERKNSSLETVVIGSASRSGEDVVVLKSVYPVYRGALVVCEGANNASVRLAVTEAVCALTGLTSDKVTVSPMG